MQARERRHEHAGDLLGGNRPDCGRDRGRGIDWLMTIVAPALFAAGIAYSTGGAAGKVQLQRMMARKNTR